jgi:signal transduction histidine kinase
MNCAIVHLREFTGELGRCTRLLTDAFRLEVSNNFSWIEESLRKHTALITRPIVSEPGKLPKIQPHREEPGTGDSRSRRAVSGAANPALPVLHCQSWWILLDVTRSGKAVRQFLFGIAGLAAITFAASRLDLQPGAVSLLYLIAVVFVSLRSGFASSLGISLIAVICLNYYFLPLFSSTGGKNPLAILATVAFLITAWVITGMVSRVRNLTEAQLTLRFEERLAERTRIARELHDTLLQSFQGLMLHFQAVNDLLPPGQAKEALDKALDRADQALVESREAIQDLRSSMAASSDLAYAIAALGEELAREHETGDSGETGKASAQLRVSVEGTSRELHPILRDDIYRIAREALRNAFHHAQASKIEAEITYGESLLRVRVRDDGKGIAPDHLDAGRVGHWGLPGMRERAQEMGAQLEVWSEVGAGTEVEMRIPGSIAYVVPVRRGGFRLFGPGKASRTGKGISR